MNTTIFNNNIITDHENKIGDKIIITGINIIYKSKSKYVKKKIETNSIFLEEFKEFFERVFTINQKNLFEIPKIIIHYQKSLL